MGRISVRIALGALLLVGAGCAPAATIEVLPKMPPEAVSEPEVTAGGRPDDAAPAAEPFYIAYTSAEYEKAKAARRPILLYFWAGWCPICRAEEPGLKREVETSGLPVAGFRVDFDVESALKSEFKVPYQHTTVIIDAEGRESARFTGPVSPVDLQAALRAAAGR